MSEEIQVRATIQPANTANSSAEKAMAEWNTATAVADEVIGYSLIGGKENDETLENLKGVPFVIEGVTFREGDISVPGTGPKNAFRRDYVSVEALIHPSYQARFKRSRVVFNDGSTGIYRQIVAYLVARGMATVDESLPEGGKAHGSRYDVSYSGPDTDDNGKRIAREFSIALVCPEGLRYSDYAGPAGDARTYYLA
jgi:hypothetical protein